MSDIYINRDCPYYDWGKTAPREYGAFCSKKKCTIDRANCGECEENLKSLKFNELLIDGCVDVSDNRVSIERFTDMFLEWIESNNWRFGGVIKPYKED
jgi:hypothetical protein